MIVIDVDTGIVRIEADSEARVCQKGKGMYHSDFVHGNRLWPERVEEIKRTWTQAQMLRGIILRVANNWPNAITYRIQDGNHRFTAWNDLNPTENIVPLIPPQLTDKYYRINPEIDPR